MISQTAEYALRATVHLALHAATPQSRAQIAIATHVPSDYLQKVLQGLDRAGIVESRRGPGGGFLLRKPAQQLDLLQIVAAVEQVPRIHQCPLGIAEHQRLCPLHQKLDDLAAGIEHVLRQTTIADLIVAQQGACEFPGRSPY